MQGLTVRGNLAVDVECYPDPDEGKNFRFRFKILARKALATCTLCKGSVQAAMAEQGSGFGCGCRVPRLCWQCRVRVQYSTIQRCPGAATDSVVCVFCEKPAPLIVP